VCVCVFFKCFFLHMYALYVNIRNNNTIYEHIRFPPKLVGQVLPMSPGMAVKLIWAVLTTAMMMVVMMIQIYFLLHGLEPISVNSKVSSVMWMRSRLR
jgi:hypothetical protein